jgi:hypothetical protein
MDRGVEPTAAHEPNHDRSRRRAVRGDAAEPPQGALRESLVRAAKRDG